MGGEGVSQHEPATAGTAAAPPVFLMACVNLRRGGQEPSCTARGALEVLAAIRAAVGRDPALQDIAVQSCYCFGRCAEGPVVRIGPGGPFFHQVTVADVPRLLEEARRFQAKLEASHSGASHSGAAPPDPGADPAP
jgi:(2Fe-2S) ferredoxin